MTNRKSRWCWHFWRYKHQSIHGRHCDQCCAWELGE